jgi:hypothetical protein
MKTRFRVMVLIEGWSLSSSRYLTKEEIIEILAGVKSTKKKAPTIHSQYRTKREMEQRNMAV